jgi:UV DNA damage endonuclease
MGEHRLGFAVKVLGAGGLPSHDTRRWQSGPHLRHSLERLRTILDYLEANDVRMYRMATALAPYSSHPELTQFHGQVEECAEELAAVGELVRERDIRLSSHPGQYTVLNSTTVEVQAAAIAELEVQAALFDAMGLGPDAVVVLHVGGAAGGKAAACDRFLAGFEQLSEAARRRLVIENDDRSFGTGDVVGLARRAGLRVAWDVLHHHCNDPEGMSDAEAIGAAFDTWPDGVTPKIHYSSPRLDIDAHTLRLPQLRAHADLVDPIGFERFMLDVATGRDFDVMLEAKAKDLALLRLREQLGARGMRSHRGRLLTPASANGADALVRLDPPG